jgi:8-oxo-dGTP pyrophosphatase MutT (NUDIX family)
MIKPWPVTDSRFVGNFRVFDLFTETKTSPLTGSAHDFTVLKCPDWVNVIAVTPEDKLVMVEQFRHASKTVELEIPGGVMDRDDVSPLEAGLRELREETGYAGDNAHIIGEIFPNPAIMANTCYTVLVENCRKQHVVQFDACEDILTHLVPVAELPLLLAAGKIRHSLVMVALSHFDLLRRGFKR